jgi:hypothetical protein
MWEKNNDNPREKSAGTGKRILQMITSEKKHKRKTEKWKTKTGNCSQKIFKIRNTR